MTIKKLKSIDIINVLSDLVSEKLETTVKLPAEVLFRNGEYRNALQVAVDILERLEPGKYEELIKRKEIKSA